MVRKASDVSSFRRFGSEVFVMNRSSGKGKLEARSRKGIFVGYSSESKAYRIWLPEERRIDTSRDVSFTDGVPSRLLTDSWEDFLPRDIPPPEMSSSPDNADAAGYEEPHIMINLLNNRGFNPEIEDQTPKVRNDDERADHDDEETTREEGEPENASRRGPGRPRIIRTGRPGRPRKIHGTATYADEDDFVFLSEIPIARAMISSESAEWTRAMADEVKSILMKNTWDLVNRPKASKVIGSRFVLRNKYGADGVLERRKGQVSSEGLRPTIRKDFHETYAPVARITSIRSTIAFAAQSGMYIRQYDVVTAYLNGELNENVYMEVPDRMEEILKYIVRTEGNKDQSAIKTTIMLNELTSGDKVCLMSKALLWSKAS